ncbi:hypothetical protein KEM56_001841 [Ascosphaera pollenicola]|nr:hypothetical protein KEM56_001841 [Ascosphaera pollenicola]
MEAIFLRARNALNDLNRDVGLSEEIYWPSISHTARTICLQAARELAAINIHLDPDILHFEWDVAQIRRFEALSNQPLNQVNDDPLYDDVDDEDDENAVEDDNNATLVNVVNTVLVGPEINPLPSLRPKAKPAQPPIEEEPQAEAGAPAEKEEEEEDLCQCCYNDVHPSKLLPCPVDKSHKACTACLTNYASNQLGLLKHELRYGKVLQKLLDLEQQACIADAEIEGLEKCAFCGYLEEYPPIDDTQQEAGLKEFFCQHPDCGKVMCRLCRAESHPNLTCDVVTKMGRLSSIRRKHSKSVSRLYIEESMTEALVRVCPNKKCRVEIIKEDGCNLMTCSRCAAKLCYLCGKDITVENYAHFGPTKPCQTHSKRDEEGDV